VDGQLLIATEIRRTGSQVAVGSKRECFVCCGLWQHRENQKARPIKNTFEDIVHVNSQRVLGIC